MKKRVCAAAAVAGMAITAAVALRAAGPDVPFPDGYRHWTFLHSSMVPPTFGDFAHKPCEKPCTAGLYHFYGNEKAMAGLKTGQYEDGAIFAEEMLEYLGNANGSGKEGPHRTTGVMVKDSKLYASTGGWGFGSFPHGSKVNELDEAARAACFQCHIPKKDRGYVFTEYTER